MISKRCIAKDLLECILAKAWKRNLIWMNFYVSLFLALKIVATPLLAMRVPVAQWFIEHPNKNSDGRS